MITSRDIDDLHPRVERLCRQFIERCGRAGIEVLVYCTYRDEEAQAALYAQGRTSPGKIVTQAKPGFSWHNWRCAFDFVPMVHGKPQWSNRDLYLQCGRIAESVGLEWAGNWNRFKEFPHCQWTGGYTLAQFQSGRVDLAKFA